MKVFNGETERQNAKVNVLAADHTNSFIKAELNTKIKLPSFLRNTITPLFDMSDIVLSAFLVSVIDENDIEHVKQISQNNGLFGIDLKKTIQDKEKQKVKAIPKVRNQTIEPVEMPHEEMEEGKELKEVEIEMEEAEEKQNQIF